MEREDKAKFYSMYEMYKLPPEEQVVNFTSSSSADEDDQNDVHVLTGGNEPRDIIESENYLTKMLLLRRDPKGLPGDVIKRSATKYRSFYVNATHDENPLAYASVLNEHHRKLDK